jgi:hypothetical protein
VVAEYLHEEDGAGVEGGGAGLATGFDELPSPWDTPIELAGAEEEDGKELAEGVEIAAEVPAGMQQGAERVGPEGEEERVLPRAVMMQQLAARRGAPGGAARAHATARAARKADLPKDDHGDEEQVAEMVDHEVDHELISMEDVHDGAEVPPCALRAPRCIDVEGYSCRLAGNHTVLVHGPGDGASTIFFHWGGRVSGGALTPSW